MLSGLRRPVGASPRLGMHPAAGPSVGRPAYGPDVDETALEVSAARLRPPDVHRVAAADPTEIPADAQASSVLSWVIRLSALVWALAGR